MPGTDRESLLFERGDVTIGSPIRELMEEVDRSLLDANLRLTVPERMDKFLSFMRLADELRRAGGALRPAEEDRPMPTTPSFDRILAALADGGVEFILIGGLAGIAHGAARATYDVDVVYRRSPENLRRLAAAMSPHEPYPRDVPPGLPFQFDEVTLSRGLNFTLTTRLGDLDLMGEIPGGGDFEALSRRTVSLVVFGRRCLCLDLPTLIHVKRAAGRAKDMLAVAELEGLRERST